MTDSALSTLTLAHELTVNSPAGHALKRTHEQCGTALINALKMQIECPELKEKAERAFADIIEVLLEVHSTWEKTIKAAYDDLCAMDSP